jgi:DNA repair exonuclease SbcCD nuclease subunit
VKRTKSIERPDLILTSDWHLREDTPVCRTDNFWESQWDKVHQISHLQREYDCPVIHAGDLYHHWKPSPLLISKTLESLPRSFHTVYGQHDLPNHSMELSYKSGIFAILSANRLSIMDGSWGDHKPGEIRFLNKVYKNRESRFKHRVGVWHKFVWDGKKIPWPDCDEKTAKQVLKENPEFDLIVTGDHHRPFVQHYGRKGRYQTLVNCGCLTRQDASYKDHRPRVWLWYDKDNRVEPYYLDVNPDDVTRDHLEIKELKEKRISAFISRLSVE